MAEALVEAMLDVWERVADVLRFEVTLELEAIVDESDVAEALSKLLLAAYVVVDGTAEDRESEDATVFASDVGTIPVVASVVGLAVGASCDVNVLRILSVL